MAKKTTTRKAAKKTTGKDSVAKVLALPGSEAADMCRVDKLLQGIEEKILVALLDELQNGKGIARITAAKELDAIQQRRQLDTDATVEIVFDPVAIGEAEAG